VAALRSFLLLFFKKEVLPFLLPAPSVSRRPSPPCRKARKNETSGGEPCAAATVTHDTAAYRHKPGAAMSQSAPVNALRDYLQGAQSQAIADAAQNFGQSGVLPPEALHHIAHLHLALAAISAEIDAHLPKLGSGSEEPLA